MAAASNVSAVCLKSVSLRFLYSLKKFVNFLTSLPCRLSWLALLGQTSLAQIARRTLVLLCCRLWHRRRRVPSWLLPAAQSASV